MKPKIINISQGMKNGVGHVETMYLIELRDGSRHWVLENLEDGSTSLYLPTK